MSAIARIVPWHGRAEDFRTFRELASEDPRWIARTKPLLSFLREAGPAGRTKLELRQWALRTGFGWVETEQQLCWLNNEGLVDGSNREGWRATARDAGGAT